MEVGSFYVAGVSFEGRQEYLERLESEYLTASTKKLVEFEFEPDNPFDENAIGVYVDLPERTKIGFVPKDLNKDFGEIIKQGKLVRAKLMSVGRAAPSKPLGAKICYEVDVDVNEEDVTVR